MTEKEYWDIKLFKGLKHILPVPDIKNHQDIDCPCDPIYLKNKLGITIIVVHKCFDKTRENIYDSPKLKKFLKKGMN